MPLYFSHFHWAKVLSLTKKCVLKFTRILSLALVGQIYIFKPYKSIVCPYMLLTPFHAFLCIYALFMSIFNAFFIWNSKYIITIWMNIWIWMFCSYFVVQWCRAQAYIWFSYMILMLKLQIASIIFNSFIAAQIKSMLVPILCIYDLF